MKVAAQRHSDEAAGTPLLASKLVAPSMPGRVVERPRLLKLLDSGVDRPVTLIAAPAGALALVQLARDDPAGTVSILSPFLDGTMAGADLEHASGPGRCPRWPATRSTTRTRPRPGGPASSSYSDPEGRRSRCWRAMATASCREATPSLR